MLYLLGLSAFSITTSFLSFQLMHTVITKLIMKIIMPFPVVISDLLKILPAEATEIFKE